MQERDILEALIAAGKITSADVMKVEGYSEDFRKIVDVFHHLLCNADQASAYRKESQTDTAWDSAAHVYWIDVTMRIMAELGTDTSDTIQQLNQVLQAHKDLSKTQVSLLMVLTGRMTLFDLIQVHG